MKSSTLIKTFCSSLVLYGATCLADTNDVVDQSQTESLQALMGADSFSPLGQSFIPTANKLNFIILRASDPSTASNGSYSHINIRENNINGAIIGTSDSIFLEDCFNFEEGPGCGIGGGYSAEVRYNFPISVTLTPGSTYVFEVVEESGDGINVGFSYSDIYLDGGYYKEGVLYPEDLWFVEGYSESYANTAGNVQGLIGGYIICKNLSSGDKVVIRDFNSGTFDCGSAGLQINTGDDIKVSLYGLAN